MTTHIFWVLLTIFLTACASMPATDGPDVRLLPGFTSPRDRAFLDIEIVTGPRRAIEGICQAIKKSREPLQACARVRTNSSYCVVIVPSRDTRVLEHELRHCEGYAD